LAESKRSGVFIPVSITTSQISELASEKAGERWPYESSFNSPLSDRCWKQVDVVDRSTLTLFTHHHRTCITQHPAARRRTALAIQTAFKQLATSVCRRKYGTSGQSNLA